MTEFEKQKQEIITVLWDECGVDDKTMFSNYNLNQDGLCNVQKMIEELQPPGIEIGHKFRELLSRIDELARFIDTPEYRMSTSVAIGIKTTYLFHELNQLSKEILLGSS